MKRNDDASVQCFDAEETRAARNVLRLPGRLCLATLVFVTGVIPAIALGDEGPSSTPSFLELPAGLLQGSADSPNAEVQLTDPRAADELPHNDLGREEAVDLTEAVFGPVLQSAVGPFQDLEVEKYLSQNAAVIATSAQSVSAGDDQNGEESDDALPEDHVLLESTIPLRTQSAKGGQEPVDLELEASGNHLEPKAPLVPVELPKELGDGIQLPDSSIAIDLTGAPHDRAPSAISDGGVLYPNVAPDTDFAAVPTPTGLELFTTLRNTDSPTLQSLELELPDGASLHQDDAGAKVTRNDETLLKVLPPSAIDANGKNVPVSLTVAAGNSLTLEVAPEEETAYPVLVDPIFETYNWYDSHSSDGMSSWHSQAVGSTVFTTYVPGEALIATAEPGYHSAAEQAGWIYWVPRLKEEEAVGRQPTSYIARMTLWHIGFQNWGAEGGTAPYLFAGIASVGHWAGQPGHEAIWGLAGNTPEVSMSPGYEVRLENGEPGKRDELAKFAWGLGVATNVNAWTVHHRQGMLGAASVEVADEDKPTPASGSISPWVNQTATTPITASAEDPGLGIKNIKFEVPGQGTTVSANSCLGTAPSPCPEEWATSLTASQYSSAAMQQGFNYVPISAEDPVGNKSIPGIAYGLVRVDHTAPVISLSGTVTEQGKVGTNAPEYGLKVNASDGDSAAAAATSPFGSAGTGVGKMQRPMGVAVDSGGNAYVVDRECKCVQKYDASGAFVKQFGSAGTGPGQFSDPRGIAWSSGSGRILVTDVANHSVQVFNNSGTFIRQITYGGLQEPYGIAATPNKEQFWVADLGGTHKVYKFTELGEFMTTARGTKADPAATGTDFANPVGLAVSASSIVVSDNTLNRVTVFDSSGKFVNQFGSTGIGNGQFQAPVGVAVDRGGNILVVDGLNNRIEQFRLSGEYIRQFGSGGSANNQFNEPRGLALGPGNVAYVADAANKRIAKWSHAGYDPQSGAGSIEIKVDGTLLEPKYAPGCATRDCEIVREVTLDADNYSVGQHYVEVKATDGVGLTASQSQGFITHGDLLAPSIALSGSMTEQAAIGTTRPAYLLKVNATDPGSAEERQSGVASTSIKVDGNVVDATSPGCVTGSCSISREWTLKSNNYSTGAHAVQVTATDASGRTATKTLAIEIKRDTTPPQIVANNNLFTVPGGWVEQIPYPYSPTASDLNGYGVTTLIFKIDGAVVKSAGQLCANGSCGLSLSGTLAMVAYGGGAHPAELIAIDGAGNIAKKAWTINVNPSGTVSASEATDTMEAFEDTTNELEPVASTIEFLEPEVIEAGDNPSLHENAGSLSSAGVPTSTSINLATEAVTIEGAEGALEVTPVGQGSAMPPKVEAGVAAVSSSSTSSADVVVRPEYNGALFFTDIRSVTSAEEFTWHVSLQPGQTLKAAGDQYAEVVFEDGKRMALITAQPARDATGTSVPTHLKVSGPNVTLVVSHKAGKYVYPVVAGHAFEVGYSSVVEIPPPPPVEEGELEEGEGDSGYTAPSPPLTQAQAARMIRARMKPHITVPPPAPDPSGGSATASKSRTFTVDENYTCQVDHCAIYRLYLKNPSYIRSSDWVEWEPNTQVHCGWTQNPAYYLAAIVSEKGCGFTGPSKPHKNEGKHLTIYGRWEVSAVIVAPLHQEVLTNYLALQIWVWPNGFQEPIIKHWDPGGPMEA